MCPAFYWTSTEVFSMSTAVSRNFPHFSLQTASPSLPPVPQITRNWMIFGLGNRIIATYALHFVNEEIWILLQVGASTRELKSSFYDLQYRTPFYYTMQLTLSFQAFRSLFQNYKSFLILTVHPRPSFLSDWREEK